MGNTQALPGAVATGDATVGQEPHEVIYEQALQRIAALDETWQEAVRGAAVPAGAVAPVVGAAVVDAPVAAAPVAVALRTAVIGPVAGTPLREMPPVPPVPRRPVAVTAEMAAIPGPDTAEAVVARSAAPRWRRSLAY